MDLLVMSDGEFIF